MRGSSETTWRTSRHSADGPAAACVQAGGALLDLRDGSIVLDDLSAAGSRVVLRPAIEDGTPQVSAGSGRASGVAPLRSVPSRTEWIEQSTVPRRGVSRLFGGRSDELDEVDSKVDAAHKSPFAVEPLDDLLRTIETWRAESRADNPRVAAIDLLASTARIRRERLSTVVDHEDLLALLQDSYRPAGSTAGGALAVFERPALTSDSSSGLAMLASAQKLVVTVLHDLATRGGTLDLFAISERLDRDQRSEMVWRSALDFVRSHQSMRNQVRALVADAPAGSELETSRTYAIPARVWDMFETKAPSTVHQGRRSYRARMRRTDEVVDARSDAVPTRRRGEPQLPTPPTTTIDRFPRDFSRPYRPRPGTQPLVASHAHPPVSSIHRPVPGITRLPSINLMTIEGIAERAVEAAEFTYANFAGIQDLNSVRGAINCTQAVVAVDALLDGNRNARIPLAGEGAAGVWHLQALHGGEWVPVNNHDDIITRMTERPGSRGVVYTGDSTRGHVFNVIHTASGVVYLDGQSGGISDLHIEGVTHIGLMQYMPRERAAIPPSGVLVAASIRPDLATSGGRSGTSSVTAGAHVVTDQHGTQWASSSRSARDGQGNLIPDAERACVEVTTLPHG